jgi:hypothetical protein
MIPGAAQFISSFKVYVLFLPFIHAILQIFALKFLFSQKGTSWFIIVRAASQQ